MQPPASNRLPLLRSVSTRRLITAATAPGRLGRPGAAATARTSPMSELAAPRAYYRDEPLSWAELERALLESKGLERLLRSRETQAAYEAHLERLAAAWHSVADYVLVTQLGHTRVVDAESGLLRAGAAVSSAPVFVPNDFPYHVAPGIEHHLLWCCAGPLSEREVAELVEVHRPAASWQVLRFVNPPRLRSIKAIWHAHVLSRGAFKM
jgi:Protein of unknown function (DUF3605)